MCQTTSAYLRGQERTLHPCSCRWIPTLLVIKDGSTGKLPFQTAAQIQRSDANANIGQATIKFPHIQKDTERHLKKMSIMKCFSSIVLVCSLPNTSIVIRFGWMRSEVTLRTFMLHRCERGAMAARERHGSYNRINTKARAKTIRVQNQKKNLWRNTFFKNVFSFRNPSEKSHISQSDSIPPLITGPISTLTDERNWCHGNSKYLQDWPSEFAKKKN